MAGVRHQDENPQRGVNVKQSLGAKTLIYLRNAEQDSSNEDFARVAAAVLREIDQIPRHPQDTGQRD